MKWVGQRSVFTFCKRSLKIGNGRLSAQDIREGEKASQAEPTGGPGAGADGQRADPARLMPSPVAAGEAGHCHLRSRLSSGWSVHRIPWDLAVVGEAAGLESASLEINPGSLSPWTVYRR